MTTTASGKQQDQLLKSNVGKCKTDLAYKSSFILGFETAEEMDLPWGPVGINQLDQLKNRWKPMTTVGKQILQTFATD